MPTVRDQIELERTFTEKSAQKYYNAQDKLRTKRQGDQTDASRYAMRLGIIEAAKYLKHIVETKVRGIGAGHNNLVKLSAARVDKDGNLYYDYESVIYIGMSVLFRSLGSRSTTKFTGLKATLANVLESDAKARLFEAAYPGYYFTVMQSMQKQGVTQYEHIHKVIMTKFREFEIEWQSWSVHETNAVAQKILNAILVAMPEMFFKHTYKDRGKSVTIIDTTVSADEWFAEYEKERGLINPSLPPMIIPPVPWSVDNDGNISGGYTTPRMFNSVPFVKANNSDHKEFIRLNPPKQHIQAINKLQATAWRINTEVYEVQRELFKTGKGGNQIPRYMPMPLPDFPRELKDIPVERLSPAQQQRVLDWKIATKAIHTENRLNKGKVLTYKMTIDGATDYLKHDEFYFVYNADFRGRVYCATTGLSPQGNDIAKSLLQFAEGVPMGESGMRWLAIHGANTYGNDKISNDSRALWIKSIEPQLRDVAERPLDTMGFWGAADKPWQFLSFVFEWARCDFGRSPNTLGYIPIGLDGSCNGLQHYSAILRDAEGGNAVNLTDGQVPADIYQKVADRLASILRKTGEGPAERWLSRGSSWISRKLTKRPVMTLPYGSTQQSARKYILEWLLDQPSVPWPKDDNQKYATYLTPYLWQAIGEVVIAARVGMQWIQRMATKSLKSDKPIRWLSPVGFPVYQAYFKSRTVSVDTMMMGSIAVTPDSELQDNPRIKSSYRVPTNEVDTTRQRSGIAPNFIHSVDASHMIRTINACDDRIKGFAMIHDDFGTHAGNTEYLWQVIRDEFYAMYTETEPFKDWFDYQGLDIEPNYPPQGELDIKDVLTSTYFFG